MKQSPDLQRIQDNIKPGALSADGFLGTDTRNLSDVLQADHEVVRTLGLTHEDIGKQMAYFTEKGKEGMGNPVLVEGLFEVVVKDYKGSIPCPFADHINIDKKITTVKIRATNEVLMWSDLNIHMVRAHGFYEGKGAKFRIDPEMIAKILPNYRK